MAIKIAVIGAGSIGFTLKLLRDVLSVPELQDSTFAFIDIDPRALAMMTQLARREIAANQLPATIVPTTNRRKGLDGANYVLNLTRIGGLDAFQTDIDIPLKYGVDQCVGDTLCAGGIMYGQRGIPAVLDFCRDMRAVAAPNVLFLNYGNPNAMLTWAAHAYGKVPTIGLCHGVEGGHAMIADVIERMVNKGIRKGDPRYKQVTVRDVDIICAGINHQTWYTRVWYNGEDWSRKLLAGFEQHPEFRKTEKVRIDMIKRFGYFTTESNGHISEYVPWYRKRPAEIRKWIDLSSWIHGETGGYLRICRESQNWFHKMFAVWMKEEPPRYTPAVRSHEHGSYIIEARETGRVYRGHFNVPNKGIITNLPADAIVEVPGYIDRNGVSIPRLGDLPLACAAVCNASISVQRLAVEAAVQGDVTLLKQAMLLDPLVGAVCNPPEVWQMTDEMLVAQAQWLPQYRREIARAKARLAKEPRLGTLKWQGAARVNVRANADFGVAPKKNPRH